MCLSPPPPPVFKTTVMSQLGIRGLVTILPFQFLPCWGPLSGDLLGVRGWGGLHGPPLGHPPPFFKLEEQE